MQSAEGGRQKAEGGVRARHAGPAGGTPAVQEIGTRESVLGHPVAKRRDENDFSRRFATC
jgi:hypothetical protein